VGDDSHLIRQKVLGEDGSVRRGRCYDEAARSVLAKVRGDVFARFHAVAAKVAVEPGIHSVAFWDRCFALPQLLYRWQRQSGIFWIQPLILTCVLCVDLRIDSACFPKRLTSRSP
jgi:hypothetical protein